MFCSMMKMWSSCHAGREGVKEKGDYAQAVSGGLEIEIWLWNYRGSCIIFTLDMEFLPMIIVAGLRKNPRM